MPRPNWSRPLPRSLTILDDGKEFLRLTTLADVRDFLKHIQKERRQFETWQHVEAALKKAATGGDRRGRYSADQLLGQRVLILFAKLPASNNQSSGSSGECAVPPPCRSVRRSWRSVRRSVRRS
jgi:hypothetical protein